jgi:cytochrome P450
MISSLIISAINNYNAIIVLIFTLIIYLTYSRIIYPAYFGSLSKIPRDNNPFWHYFNYIYDSYKGDPTKHLKLSQKYGPVVFLTGNKVLINDSEARKQLMSYSFPKTKLYSVYNINGPNLLSTTDKDFHIRRKRLISPAFSNKTLATMESALYKTGSESLVNYLSHHLDKDPNCEFDLYHLFNCNTLDVISELVLGTKLNATWDKKNGLYYIEELARTQFTLFKRVVIPFCSNIKLPMETLFKPMILDNINKRKLSKENHKDILQSLIDIEDPETGAKLNCSEIVDECLVLLLGGMGNTAITLTWTFYEIIRHPEILELITTEIINSFPNLKEPITYEVAKRDLKYLEAAILESMRMHPAVAGSLPRQVPQGGLTVNGHYIPSRVKLNR